MKREKILERENREKVGKESSYPSDKIIMIEIIRGPIKVTQYESNIINFE